jgi:hypothetical protein
MRILNNNEKKLCVTRFEELISKDIDMCDMFSVLDAVMYEYINFILRDDASCPTDNQSENLYYLKKLRDIFTDNKKSIPT